METGKVVISYNEQAGRQAGGGDVQICRGDRWSDVGRVRFYDLAVLVAKRVAEDQHLPIQHDERGALCACVSKVLVETAGEHA